MLQLQPAQLTDSSAIKNICDDARRFQHSQGFEQWPEGYPSPDVIASDIASNKGYLILVDGDIVGYCVIDLNGDCEYDLKRDIWQTYKPYAAVHRLALSAEARGKRLGLPILNIIERLVANRGIRVIKVDTGLENIRMQRLLASAGYSCRGQHQFSWGPRLAYEKEIE
ncbi:MAG: GNAT family N-acetyltransferase [Muribaculaceae bacterium]|nr:GNAT family N-acetyltransferase [Muribaculaceae bacterium]